MGEPALAFLLDLVKEVMKDYKDVISGAENEFEQLNNELRQLKAYLKGDVQWDSREDSLLKELERQIRDVVYEVEDTIDACLTRAIQVKGFPKSMLKYFSSTHFGLAKEVKSIRENKVKPLFDQAKLNFAGMKIPNGSGGVEDQRTILTRENPIRQHRVVGFNMHEETITGYLMTEKQSLEVIPIIGTPGQGKTTLAWKVYQNKRVRDNFPNRIWVYISQKFNSRDVYLHILQSFAPSIDNSKLDKSKLEEMVSSCLEKDKFLLVLDDVWSIDAWNVIENILPVNNGKGKVLITSRDMKVGARSATVKAHEIKPLNDTESWTLLQLGIYGNEKDCPHELRGMGQHLAKKCRGVLKMPEILKGSAILLSARSSFANPENPLDHEV